MTFEAFKTEFDETLGAMIATELLAAFRAAGVNVNDDWTLDAAGAAGWEGDASQSGEGVATDSSELALAA